MPSLSPPRDGGVQKAHTATGFFPVGYRDKIGNRQQKAPPKDGLLSPRPEFLESRFFQGSFSVSTGMSTTGDSFFPSMETLVKRHREVARKPRHSFSKLRSYPIPETWMPRRAATKWDIAAKMSGQNKQGQEQMHSGHSTKKFVSASKDIPAAIALRMALRKKLAHREIQVFETPEDLACVLDAYNIPWRSIIGGRTTSDLARKSFFFHRKPALRMDRVFRLSDFQPDRANSRERLMASGLERIMSEKKTEPASLSSLDDDDDDATDEDDVREIIHSTDLSAASSGFAMAVGRPPEGSGKTDKFVPGPAKKQAFVSRLKVGTIMRKAEKARKQAKAVKKAFVGMGSGAKKKAVRKRDDGHQHYPTRMFVRPERKYGELIQRLVDYTSFLNEDDVQRIANTRPTDADRKLAAQTHRELHLGSSIIHLEKLRVFRDKHRCEILKERKPVLALTNNAKQPEAGADSEKGEKDRETRCGKDGESRNTKAGRKDSDGGKTATTDGDSTGRSSTARSTSPVNKKGSDEALPVGKGRGTIEGILTVRKGGRNPGASPKSTLKQKLTLGVEFSLEDEGDKPDGEKGGERGDKRKGGKDADGDDRGKGIERWKKAKEELENLEGGFVIPPASAVVCEKKLTSHHTAMTASKAWNAQKLQNISPRRLERLERQQHQRENGAKNGQNAGKTVYDAQTTKSGEKMVQADWDEKDRLRYEENRLVRFQTKTMSLVREATGKLEGMTVPIEFCPKRVRLARKQITPFFIKEHCMARGASKTGYGGTGNMLNSIAAPSALKLLEDDDEGLVPAGMKGKEATRRTMTADWPKHLQRPISRGAKDRGSARMSAGATRGSRRKSNRLSVLSRPSGGFFDPNRPPQEEIPEMPAGELAAGKSTISMNGAKRKANCRTNLVSGTELEQELIQSGLRIKFEGPQWKSQRALKEEMAYEKMMYQKSLAAPFPSSLNDMDDKEFPFFDMDDKDFGDFKPKPTSTGLKNEIQKAINSRKPGSKLNTASAVYNQAQPGLATLEAPDKNRKKRRRKLDDSSTRFSSAAGSPASQVRCATVLEACHNPVASPVFARHISSVYDVVDERSAAAKDAADKRIASMAPVSQRFGGTPAPGPIITNYGASQSSRSLATGTTQSARKSFAAMSAGRSSTDALSDEPGGRKKSVYDKKHYDESLEILKHIAVQTKKNSMEDLTARFPVPFRHEFDHAVVQIFTEYDKANRNREAQNAKALEQVDSDLYDIQQENQHRARKSKLGEDPPTTVVDGVAFSSDKSGNYGTIGAAVRATPAFATETKIENTGGDNYAVEVRRVDIQKAKEKASKEAREERRRKRDEEEERKKKEQEKRKKVGGQVAYYGLQTDETDVHRGGRVDRSEAAAEEAAKLVKEQREFMQAQADLDKLVVKQRRDKIRAERMTRAHWRLIEYSPCGEPYFEFCLCDKCKNAYYLMSVYLTLDGGQQPGTQVSGVSGPDVFGLTNDQSPKKQQLATTLAETGKCQKDTRKSVVQTAVSLKPMLTIPSSDGKNMNRSGMSAATTATGGTTHGSSFMSSTSSGDASVDKTKSLAIEKHKPLSVSAAQKGVDKQATAAKRKSIFQKTPGVTSAEQDEGKVDTGVQKQELDARFFLDPDMLETGLENLKVPYTAAPIPPYAADDRVTPKYFYADIAFLVRGFDRNATKKRKDDRKTIGHVAFIEVLTYLGHIRKNREKEEETEIQREVKKIWEASGFVGDIDFNGFLLVYKLYCDHLTQKCHRSYEITFGMTGKASRFSLVDKDGQPSAVVKQITDAPTATLGGGQKTYNFLQPSPDPGKRQLFTKKDDFLDLLEVAIASAGFRDVHELALQECCTISRVNWLYGVSFQQFFQVCAMLFRCYQFAPSELATYKRKFTRKFSVNQVDDRKGELEERRKLEEKRKAQADAAAREGNVAKDASGKEIQPELADSQPDIKIDTAALMNKVLDFKEHIPDTVLEVPAVFKQGALKVAGTHVLVDVINNLADGVLGQAAVVAELLMDECGLTESKEAIKVEFKYLFRRDDVNTGACISAGQRTLSHRASQSSLNGQGGASPKSKKKQESVVLYAKSSYMEWKQALKKMPVKVKANLPEESVIQFDFLDYLRAMRITRSIENRLSMELFFHYDYDNSMRLSPDEYSLLLLDLGMSCDKECMLELFDIFGTWEDEDGACDRLPPAPPLELFDAIAEPVEISNPIGDNSLASSALSRSKSGALKRQTTDRLKGKDKDKDRDADESSQDKLKGLARAASGLNEEGKYEMKNPYEQERTAADTQEKDVSFKKKGDNDEKPDGSKVRVKIANSSSSSNSGSSSPGSKGSDSKDDVNETLNDIGFRGDRSDSDDERRAHSDRDSGSDRDKRDDIDSSSVSTLSSIRSDDPERVMKAYIPHAQKRLTRTEQVKRAEVESLHMRLKARARRLGQQRSKSLGVIYDLRHVERQARVYNRLNHYEVANAMYVAEKQEGKTGTKTPTGSVANDLAQQAAVSAASADGRQSRSGGGLKTTAAFGKEFRAKARFTITNINNDDDTSRKFKRFFSADHSYTYMQRKAEMLLVGRSANKGIVNAGNAVEKKRSGSKYSENASDDEAPLQVNIGASKSVIGATRAVSKLKEYEKNKKSQADRAAKQAGRADRVRGSTEKINGDEKNYDLDHEMHHDHYLSQVERCVVPLGIGRNQLKRSTAYSSRGDETIAALNKCPTRSTAGRSFNSVKQRMTQAGIRYRNERKSLNAKTAKKSRMARLTMARGTTKIKTSVSEDFEEDEIYEITGRGLNESGFNASEDQNLLDMCYADKPSLETLASSNAPASRHTQAPGMRQTVAPGMRQTVVSGRGKTIVMPGKAFGSHTSTTNLENNTSNSKGSLLDFDDDTDSDYESDADWSDEEDEVTVPEGLEIPFENFTRSLAHIRLSCGYGNELRARYQSLFQRYASTTSGVPELTSKEMVVAVIGWVFAPYEHEVAATVIEGENFLTLNFGEMLQLIRKIEIALLRPWYKEFYRCYVSDMHIPESKQEHLYFVLTQKDEPHRRHAISNLQFLNMMLTDQMDFGADSSVLLSVPAASRVNQGGLARLGSSGSVKRQGSSLTRQSSSLPKTKGVALNLHQSVRKAMRDVDVFREVLLRKAEIKWNDIITYIHRCRDEKVLQFEENGNFSPVDVIKLKKFFCAFFHLDYERYFGKALASMNAGLSSSMSTRRASSLRGSSITMGSSALRGSLSGLPGTAALQRKSVSHQTANNNRLQTLREDEDEEDMSGDDKDRRDKQIVKRITQSKNGLASLGYGTLHRSRTLDAVAMVEAAAGDVNFKSLSKEDFVAESKRLSKALGPAFSKDKSPTKAGKPPAPTAQNLANSKQRVEVQHNTKTSAHPDDLPELLVQRLLVHVWPECNKTQDNRKWLNMQLDHLMRHFGRTFNFPIFIHYCDSVKEKILREIYEDERAALEEFYPGNIRLITEKHYIKAAFIRLSDAGEQVLAPVLDVGKRWISKIMHFETLEQAIMQNAFLRAEFNSPHISRGIKNDLLRLWRQCVVTVEKIIPMENIKNQNQGGGGQFRASATPTTAGGAVGHPTTSAAGSAGGSASGSAAGGQVRASEKKEETITVQEERLEFSGFIRLIRLVKYHHIIETELGTDYANLLDPKTDDLGMWLNPTTNLRRMGQMPEGRRSADTLAPLPTVPDQSQEGAEKID